MHKLRHTTALSCIGIISAMIIPVKAMPTDTTSTSVAAIGHTMPDGPSEWAAPDVVLDGITIAESYLKGKKSGSSRKHGA